MDLADHQKLWLLNQENSWQETSYDQPTLSLSFQEVHFVVKWPEDISMLLFQQRQHAFQQLNLLRKVYCRLSPLNRFLHTWYCQSIWRSGSVVSVEGLRVANTVKIVDPRPLRQIVHRQKSARRPLRRRLLSKPQHRLIAHRRCRYRLGVSPLSALRWRRQRTDASSYFAQTTVGSSKTVPHPPSRPSTVDVAILHSWLPWKPYRAERLQFIRRRSSISWPPAELGAWGEGELSESVANCLKAIDWREVY